MSLFLTFVGAFSGAWLGIMTAFLTAEWIERKYKK